MSASRRKGNPVLRLRSISPLVWVPAIAAVLIFADLLTKSPAQSLTREHGGIELASAFLYVAAAGVWIGYSAAGDWARSWQIPAVLLMMAGREFDLDKSITSVGVLKSNLYLTDQAPVWERLLGAAVLVFLAVVLLRLVRVNGPPFLRDLRRGGLGALAVVAGIGTAVFAKAIDGLARKLAPLGIDINNATGASFGALEETVELLVPFLFLLAILHNLRPARTAPAAAAAES